MRTLRALLIPLLLGGLAAGCHLHTSNHVQGGVLGRVVIYRNGVAFYERNASVEDGRLVVHVPRDKVDDFLKSLTVVDRDTNQRLSVSIPRKEADDGSYLTMTLETPDRRKADACAFTGFGYLIGWPGVDSLSQAEASRNAKGERFLRYACDAGAKNSCKRADALKASAK